MRTYLSGMLAIYFIFKIRYCFSSYTKEIFMGLTDAIFIICKLSQLYHNYIKLNKFEDFSVFV